MGGLNVKDLVHAQLHGIDKLSEFSFKSGFKRNPGPELQDCLISHFLPDLDFCVQLGSWESFGVISLQSLP